MNIDRIVFVLAGTLILIGITLGLLVNPYWLILPGFVGFNMLQSAFTGFCPAAIVLKKAGVKSGCAFE